MEHDPSAHPEANRAARRGGHSAEYDVTRDKDKFVFVTTGMRLAGMTPSEKSMKFQDRWN